MKPLKTPASFVVIALLICACTVLFGQSEEQSTEPSKLTIVNVQSYLCDRLDNSANEQDPAVWPHDVLLRKQASTGVRKYIVRHPQPKQPKGFVYHYNSMMLTRRIDDAMN